MGGAVAPQRMLRLDILPVSCRIWPSRSQTNSMCEWQVIVSYHNTRYACTGKRLRLQGPTRPQTAPCAGAQDRQLAGFSALRSVRCNKARRIVKSVADGQPSEFARV